MKSLVCHNETLPGHAWGMVAPQLGGTSPQALASTGLVLILEIITVSPIQLWHRSLVVDTLTSSG